MISTSGRLRQGGDDTVNIQNMHGSGYILEVG
jgi:hypothetical protein